MQYLPHWRPRYNLISKLTICNFILLKLDVFEWSFCKPYQRKKSHQKYKNMQKFVLLSHIFHRCYFASEQMLIFTGWFKVAEAGGSKLCCQFEAIRLRVQKTGVSNGEQTDKSFSAFHTKQLLFSDFCFHFCDCN